jgi:hypothetical protein
MISKRRRHWTEQPIVLATFATIAILCNLTVWQPRFLTDETKVPIMYEYTFYSKITDVPMPAGTMAHADHSRLLRFWVSTWEQVGWQAVVLYKAHAQQHLDYGRLKPLVEATGAGTYNSSKIVGTIFQTDVPCTVRTALRSCVSCHGNQSETAGPGSKLGQDLGAKPCSTTPGPWRPRRALVISRPRSSGSPGSG